jgi:hypothetical protein
MGRKLRVQYPGAIYHLMNRGDRREPIFKDDLDRRRFLETLGEACGKTGWQVHAWCIPNHCHCTISAAPTEGMPSAFTAECCCNACIHAGLTAYHDWRNDRRPTRPGFYPDTPPTNHGTDYPFENEQ